MSAGQPASDAGFYMRDPGKAQANDAAGGPATRAPQAVRPSPQRAAPSMAPACGATADIQGEDSEDWPGLPWMAARREASGLAAVGYCTVSWSACTTPS